MDIDIGIDTDIDMDIDIDTPADRKPMHVALSTSLCQICIVFHFAFSSFVPVAL